MYGIKVGVLTAEEAAALKAELETATWLAGRMTKAELLAGTPGYGLEKFTKKELVTRAIALHGAAWEASR